MNLEKLNILFNEKYEDEFLEFGKVENKRSNRPDLHAMILLDTLVPSSAGLDMICSAEHDEIWFGVDAEDLCEIITEEQVLELVRCGVRFSDDSLCMFA